MPKKSKGLGAKKTLFDYVKHPKSKIKRGQSARKRAEKKVLNRILNEKETLSQFRASIATIRIRKAKYFSIVMEYSLKGPKAFVGKTRFIEREINRLIQVTNLAKKSLLLKKVPEKKKNVKVIDAEGLKRVIKITREYTAELREILKEVKKLEKST